MLFYFNSHFRWGSRSRRMTFQTKINHLSLFECVCNFFYLLTRLIWYNKLKIAKKNVSSLCLLLIFLWFDTIVLNHKPSIFKFNHFLDFLRGSRKREITFKRRNCRKLRCCTPHFNVWFVWCIWNWIYKVYILCFC